MSAASEPRALCLSPSTSEPRDRTEAAEAGLRMDEASFVLFYERSAPKLFAYLLRVSGGRSLAEDILQESFCRFLQSKLPPMNDAAQRSYLFRIASNVLRDRWRRHREDAVPENLAEPTSGPPQLERQLDLRQAFGHLKLRERQLLWLAYVEGSNHNEIAGITGLRPASVRLLLFRARRRLADLIRSQGAEKRNSK